MYKVYKLIDQVRMTKETYLRCTICDNNFIIRRKKGKLRPRGHIKHIWCYVCQEIVENIELLEYEL